MGIIKFYKQEDRYDCVAACAKTIMRYYGLSFPANIKTFFNIGSTGTNFQNLKNGFENLGFDCQQETKEINNLILTDSPKLLFFDGNHFVVLFKIKDGKYYIIDPSIGKIILSTRKFKKRWVLPGLKEDDDEYGVVFTLNPNPKKKIVPTLELNEGFFSIKKLIGLLFNYKKSVLRLFVIFLLGSVIQLIIPFLTKSVVDKGIENQDVNFIYIILFSQLMLVAGSLVADYIRALILTHIGIRININLSDIYINNLIGNPTSFFYSKSDGDLLQRLNDNDRVESFITRDLASFVLSILNIIVFGLVLLIFNTSIFLVFLISTILLIGWIFFFLKKRKKIDNERFKFSARTRNYFLEMINGIEEIKSNNLQKQFKENWYQKQMDLLKVRINLVLVGQFQRIGAVSINQLKNTLITFISALAVISGDLSIGAMAAIQFLIGQLNSPIRDIVSFVQSYQDTKLSIGRLNDVIFGENKNNSNENLDSISIQKEIHFENIQFSYGSTKILKNITLNIPQGSYCAIVGESGSGKTTLLKIINGLIPISSGKFKVGDTDFKVLNKSHWFDNISIVSQDGHIFSDSLAYNISLTNNVDDDRLMEAIQLSLLDEVVKKLPLGIKTTLVANGKKLSKGQRQRILIARAIYKNGNYLLLDEASSALDNITEAKVIRNLKNKFSNKTIIAVAHKLSTIKDADKIIILEDGQILEQGSHSELYESRGHYFTMLENIKQL